MVKKEDSLLPLEGNTRPPALCRAQSKRMPLAAQFSPKLLEDFARAAASARRQRGRHAAEEARRRSRATKT
eukprot:5090141-Lingulodinium_polyedra.AAC.1